jgi:hypothetical protein
VKKVGAQREREREREERCRINVLSQVFLYQHIFFVGFGTLIFLYSG